MPRLNYGTLLENIVVLEAVRLCLEHSAKDKPLAFASSFAMPPLTQCWAKDSEPNNNPSFCEPFLSKLSCQQNKSESIGELWSLCINNKVDLPVCTLKEDFSGAKSREKYSYGGPNGALLVSMLARQRERSIHCWLNDDGQRYGETTHNVQSELSNTVSYGALFVGAKEGDSSVKCNFGMFPSTITDLKTWLTQEQVALAPVRVGFLDPDNYTEGSTQVTRRDHQVWLRALAENSERCISIMYSSCQNRGSNNIERNRRLSWFHDDANEIFPRSVVFENGNHQAGLKIRWTRDALDLISGEVIKSVSQAWLGWSQRLKPLLVHVNGKSS